MSNILEKGGKGAPIGTRKEFGGREYIKTADGWKFVGKGKGKSAQKHIDAHKNASIDQTAGKKQSGDDPNKLQDHAKNTPTENLQRVAHDESKPQELRDAAQKELSDRKEGEESVKKQHDSPEQNDAKSSKDPEENKDGVIDVTDKKEEKIPADYGLPNEESAKQAEVLNAKDGAAKLNEQTEGFSVKKEESLTSESTEDKKEDDINHKFEAFGRFAAGVIKGRMKSLIAYGSGGVGKELWEESGVYTPKGKVKIKDLQEGDQVLTPKGTVTTVTGVFPQGVKPLYKFQLKDGSSVLAGLEHQWKVWDKTNYWCKEQKKRITKGRWVVMNTQQLIDKGIKMREKSISSNGKEIPAEWRFLIPYLPTPALFDEQKLPLPPYFIGYMLGDGWMNNNTIAVAIGDEDVQESTQNIKKDLTFFDVDLVDRGNCVFDIIRSKKVRDYYISLDLHDKKAYNKFIPKQYIYNSIENRLELLRGLMDTDGSCEGSKGHCVYYTISEQLAQDVKELVLSFGLYASVSKVKRKFSGLAKQSREKNNIFDSISEIYQVYFTMPAEYNPFKLKRKADKWERRVRRNDIRGKSIVAINYERDDQAVCISVEDEDRLFLTEDFITTHNTYTVTTELQKAGKKIFDPELHDPGDDGYDYVKMTGKMTAAAVYQAMYEHNGKILLFDDCDSVLQDENAINLFKGALDTSGDGTIDWGSAKKLKDSTGQEIPGKFPFSGRAIFISNLDMNDKAGEKIQPIVSRGYGINLSMDAKKTMERIRHIATSKDGKLTNLRFPGTPDYSHEDMDAVLKYMDKHKNHAADLNVRTVGTLLAIKKDADEAGVPWEDDAKYVYLRKSNDIDIYNGSVFHQRKQAIEKALGVDNRSIEERKIDWCNMKKASLKGCVTSRDMK